MSHSNDETYRMQIRGHKMINAIKVTMGGIIWATIVGNTILYVTSVVWPVGLGVLVVGLFLLAIGDV